MNHVITWSELKTFLHFLSEHFLLVLWSNLGSGLLFLIRVYLDLTQCWLLNRAKSFWNTMSVSRLRKAFFLNQNTRRHEIEDSREYSELNFQRSVSSVSKVRKFSEVSSIFSNVFYHYCINYHYFSYFQILFFLLFISSTSLTTTTMWNYAENVL